MIRSRVIMAFWLAALLLDAASAPAQQVNLHIGYVYPAGGRRGTTFDAVIGGQFLTGVNDVLVSGGGVRATITKYIRPMTGKERNALRIRMDELLARRAVVRKDFRALEAFRSFKNAKTVKTDTAAHDQEIERLQKKYAGATWTAADDRLLAEVRKKIANGKRRPANPAISELSVVRMTVAEDAAPGRRELRIASPSGLSNPLVFCVGQLAEFSKEASKTIPQQKNAAANPALGQNSKPLPEMRVALPAVVNGQILPGAVDRFRFTASKGQRLVVAAAARELIPYIADAVPGWFQATLALYDAHGKELAYAGDYRFHQDPVLYCPIPADGEYHVEIKDAIYRGREDFVYRITIGELPFVTSIFPLGGPSGTKTTVKLQGWNLPMTSLTMDNRDKLPGIYPICVSKGGCISNTVPFAVDGLPECLEKEPNDQPSRAQQVTLPVMVNGRINQPGDWDVFRFEGRSGSEVVAEVYARRLNSPLDSVLKLTDATGRRLAFNDDHEDRGSGLLTHHADSWLRVALPADGTYYLHLGDAQHKGGPEYAYRLRISAPRPDFELRVAPSSGMARITRVLPLTVYALRRDGFSGEIALALKNAPKGFAISGGLVAANQDQVRITLTVPPTSQKGPFNVHLEGRATIGGVAVVHPAVPVEDMTQAFEYRHLVPSRELEVAVAEGAPARIAIKLLGKTPVKIPAGGTARVEIGVPANRFLGRFQLDLNDPPEGIAIQKVSPSNDRMVIVLASEAAKVRIGQKGNLIVTVSRSPDGSTDKGKAKANQRRAPLATLPAIAFEVVKPL